MSGVYALLRPDGPLEFRIGVPDQMSQDTGPHDGGPSAITIQRETWGGRGLQGQVGNISYPAGRSQPANHTGSRLAAALGGPEECLFGNLAICGTQIDPSNGKPTVCGLTEAQQHLIRSVHAAVCQEAHTIP
ncbi:hypothetical protein ABT317_20370 [Streptomyces carpinensis]|uniref:Uncharacterized protein n=1 Tax=Streptomyces carpinensis TaxID=66369 RepID=A0ABV1W698_9ACTN